MRKDCKHFSRIDDVCWACDYKDEQENRTDTITALESKFALAVEALESISSGDEPSDDGCGGTFMYETARDALAKIKG